MEEVTLIVTVQVSKLADDRLTREDAEDAAREAIWDTLATANNRGYHHGNELLGVCMLNVNVMEKLC